jgi:hypothetical protein
MRALSFRTLILSRRPIFEVDRTGAIDQKSLWSAETLNSSSLEWRDEKELQEHPDVVNEKAETGLKKAEASAHGEHRPRQKTAKCGHYHSEP